MVGAPYEFDMGDKSKDFPMWKPSSRKTDDTVMTIAVADALLDTRFKSNEKIKKALVTSMKHYGALYPDESANAHTIATANICCSPAES